MAEPNFFDDEEFQDRLVALLVSDTVALKQCAHLLEANDFKPLRGMQWGRPRWIVAERALDYYRKYHEPVGGLLRADVLDYARGLSLGNRQLVELDQYCQHLVKVSRKAPQSITEKVVHFKHELLKARTIQEMVELQAAGNLTDDEWYRLSQQAVQTVNGSYNATDFFATLEDRVRRRQLGASSVHIPSLFIDPFDSLVRGPGRRQVALVLAPYGRGKSIFLIWVAIAYTLQHFRTLYITLEDPREEVENRMDAAVTAVPVLQLGEQADLLQQRFRRFARFVKHSRLRLIDGSDVGMTVGKIEQVLLRERAMGFQPDAVFIDYDAKIVPPRRREEHRFESQDIYTALTRLAARYNVIVWTAAQTKRDTSALKIITGDKAAEDLWKIREVSVAVSLGQGDWGPDSIYLWVAKHRFDSDRLGCHIVSDKQRMIIYDRDKTQRAAVEYEQKWEDTGG